MKTTIFSLIIWVLGCSREATPFSGAYKLPNTNITALALNYNFKLMIGLDTCIFYGLHLLKEIKSPVNGDAIYVFNATYSGAVTRLGFHEDIKCPLKFKLDEEFGNTLVVEFYNNESMAFGGTSFERPENSEECEKILADYYDLLKNNVETQIRFGD